MLLALGITAAIVARDRQGLGQHVDSSLLGSQLALQGAHLVRYMRGGVQAPSPQRRNPIFAYSRATDGKSPTIGLLDPRWWTALANTLGRPELIDDLRFDKQFDRREHRLDLLAALDTAFAKRNRDEWLACSPRPACPAAPSTTMRAPRTTPQALANDYITTLEHPSVGEVGVVGSPIRMSETPVKPRHTAPELGQHTEELLLGLGYDWEAIATLKDREVI